MRADMNGRDMGDAHMYTVYTLQFKESRLLDKIVNRKFLLSLFQTIASESDSMKWQVYAKSSAN